jgi:hypothetical protein
MITIPTKKLLELIDTLDTDSLIKYYKEKRLQLTEEEYKAIIVCTLLIFEIELMLKKIAVDGITKPLPLKFKNIKFYEFLFTDKLTFKDKIDVIEWVITKGKTQKTKWKEFLKYCRDINQLRNKLFHVKLDQLKYKGNSILELRTQRQMLKDFIFTSRKGRGID